MSQIILASQSPRRKELLEQIGLEFEICPAKGEEIITKSIPEEVVMELSKQKAEEVAAQYGGKPLNLSGKINRQEMIAESQKADRDAKSLKK